jgi:putative hydrolase of the HAD superfamily
METLVDMDPVPTSKDYAAWSFRDSGVERHWQDFDQFQTLFDKAGKMLSASKAKNEEWSMLDRLQLICSETGVIEPDRMAAVAGRLEQTFFNAYCARCFLRPDVKEVVPQLARKFKLGVVSNFKVQQGIFQILDRLHLLPYFEWILTSVETGWRKPDPLIYQAALQRTGSSADRILFIGDDLLNDVITPLELGMNSLLLDRKRNHRLMNNYTCITSFFNLSKLL